MSQPKRKRKPRVRRPTPTSRPVLDRDLVRRRVGQGAIALGGLLLVSALALRLAARHDPLAHHASLTIQIAGIGLVIGGALLTRRSR